MQRLEVILKMKNAPIVPLFYHEDEELCKDAIRACYEGGARVFEFTNRGKRALEIFTSLKKHFSKELPELALGIGSIVDAPTAALFLQAGADFVVSPICQEELIRHCNRQKVLILPGCSTLTEISKAEELGIEIAKLFPGDLLGPSFVSAVKGPCPWTQLMPSGGVELSAENLGAWFKAGVFCVGVGSKLFTPEVIRNKNYAALTERLQEGFGIIESLRSTKKELVR